jgi:hypothetical protein
MSSQIQEESLSSLLEEVTLEEVNNIGFESTQATSLAEEDEKCMEEAKYEIALLYDERVSRHPNNREELQIRCSLIYDELVNQKVLLINWIVSLG